MKNVLNGIGITKKAGIGSALVMEESKATAYTAHSGSATEETEIYMQAVRRFVSDTKKRSEELAGTVGYETVADILNSHIGLVCDVQFDEDVRNLLASSKETAMSAVSKVCDNYIDMFSHMDNEVLKLRAEDFSDIKRQLVEILTRTSDDSYGTQGDLDNSLQDASKVVIVARNLQPSQTAGLDREKVAGIVTECGSATSHAAILVRAKGIPAVFGVCDATRLVHDGDIVVVDGINECVYINPEENVVNELSGEPECLSEKESELMKYAEAEVYADDKTKVHTMINIDCVDEIKDAMHTACDGVGLFRTEYLFMNRNEAPSVARQFEIYKTAAERCRGKILTIRLIDVGGDKQVPYMTRSMEDNPALGLRGIRLAMAKDSVLKDQLRAILMASAYGHIRIMIPMVSCISELRYVKNAVVDIKNRLADEHIAYDGSIKTGIMVETPSAVMMADVLAKEADFFSIGTNDLTQYMMASDRGNASVGYLSRVYAPAVLRAIKRVIDCGTDAGIDVSMCGEAAGDAYLTALLLGMGLRSFSMSETALPNIKKVMLDTDIDEAKALWSRVADMKTADEVYQVLSKCG